MDTQWNMPEEALSDWKLPLYAAACGCRQEGTLSGLLKAAREFSLLGAYRDAEEQSAAASARIEQLCAEIRAEAEKAKNLRIVMKARTVLEAAAENDSCRKAAEDLLELQQELFKKEEKRYKITRICAAVLGSGIFLSFAGIFIRAMAG